MDYRFFQVDGACGLMYSDIQHRSAASFSICRQRENSTIGRKMEL